MFAVPNSPLAQPWNAIFGSAVGAFIGVSTYRAFHHLATDFDDITFVAAACAVSLTVAAMHLTKSIHPPAGATALIAVMGSPRIHELGYMYVVFPAIVASALQVVLGTLLNNLSAASSRRYPTAWLPFVVSVWDKIPAASSKPAKLATDDHDRTGHSQAMSNADGVPAAEESATPENDVKHGIVQCVENAEANV